MKKGTRFSFKMLAIALALCLALAGIGAWLSGLNVWILFLILFGAVFVNGVIAHMEDETSSWGAD